VALYVTRVTGHGTLFTVEQAATKMTIKRIHVNQHVIRRNLKVKEGPHEPAIAVKEGKKNTYGHGVTVHGPSKVVYSPDKPLSCGARVWIETTAEVDIE
tara:strand:- start:2327 stop:2623 length:297 start_codon:yes stop_codon:yes gene_type:complete